MDNYDEILRKREEIVGGDPGGIEKQHGAGKLTARERIDKLLDEGSFVELDALCGEGVVTGFGTVEDRPVYLYAQDFTVKSGAVGVSHARKIIKVLDLALKSGAPVVSLCDSGGARIDEGPAALAAYAEIIMRHGQLSGAVPQIALVLGPCMGGAALVPALCDVIIMADKISGMYTAGPQVISAKSGKNETPDQIGGPLVHGKAGTAHLTAASEAEAIEMARRVLSLLPSNCEEDAPFVNVDDLNREVAYSGDILALASGLLDAGSCIELSKLFAPETVTAIGRLGGHPVGLLAMKGTLGESMAVKAAAFARLCDCFNLPVVTLCDIDGFAAVGSQPSLISSAARLAYAFAESTCPKITFVQKAVGVAFSAVCAKAAVDLCYGFADAMISALPPETAVEIACKKEIGGAKDPDERRAELVRRYETETATALAAAKSGVIDDIIDPAQTRKMAIYAIEMLSSKRESRPPKKHGNPPIIL